MIEDRQNPAGFEWLDLRRLRGYLVVSERTLHAWIHLPMDPLPAVRVRVKMLVRRREFDPWLDRHHIQPDGEFDVCGVVDEILTKVGPRD